MRARPRRALLQLSIFAIILTTILLLNRPARSKSFPWSKILYKTHAATLPPPHGKCPNLSLSTKPALIVSRVESDGNPSWLEKLADKYTLCIYTVDDSPPPNTNAQSQSSASKPTLQVPSNRGHEAMAYLTYLIDNYSTLPPASIFIHGSRWAWHNDSPNYDNAALLRDLNIPAALAPSGYHNLRCDWSAGTCASTVPAQGSLEMRLQAAIAPWSARAASDTALPRALAALFGGEDTLGFKSAMLGRSDAVRAQCCAQFVVSRERVWQHSREEYVALRQWLLDGAAAAASAGGGGGGGGGRRARGQSGLVAPSDDKVAGRILSYIWHILFAETQGGLIGLEELNRAACPSAQECYCRLYGRCQLQCAGPGSCQGQYSVPKYYKLPDDWAETDS